MRCVRLLLVLFALLNASIASTSASEPARKAENVIVVTLDGFRWQELFGGADESFIDAKQGGVQRRCRAEEAIPARDTAEAGGEP